MGVIMRRTRKRSYFLVIVITCFTVGLYICQLRRVKQKAVLVHKKELLELTESVIETSINNAVDNTINTPVTDILEIPKAPLPRKQKSLSQTIPDTHVPTEPKQAEPELEPDILLEPAPISNNTNKSTTDTVIPRDRTITIQNDITHKMITYKHWTGSYTPSIFDVSINGQILKEGEKRSITIHDNKLIISYRYSFMKGYRVGARNITFKVNPEAQLLSITFAWKNKWHVLLDQASPELAEEIAFKA
jgi:hypothetical protein